MQFKLAYLTAALATIASATPTSLTARGQGGQCIPSSDCSTGPVQCCDTSSVAGSSVVGSLISTIALGLGITIPSGTLVGLTCTNVVSGGTCNSQAVCCNDNSHNSLISIGCVPVQL
ncbi:hypothetical protein GYMLUDRAFT_242934 [Collybiopsis luxurians FD-317 M1]|uniref:Hydrophobin n=1 Tax=Collybiopsis luxurians FD-317 M1 TaxID=944289 RepID=A0A0D0CHX0_9AGAR|nr:hypothetical protein GYMLUDRAFT_242934 [Collybiopsis luxurians FD-317 M1]